MGQATAAEVGTDGAQSRSRLVDHFKRSYQIIVGLSITLACSNLFRDGVGAFPDPTFWMFCAFFITVVPIFHGGDRSLDIKYLRIRPEGFWQQAAYVWDVYMLLITAILFVKIAQSIPGGTPIAAFAPADTGAQALQSGERFYGWMAGMLVFDVFVLAVDGVKNAALRSSGLDAFRAYMPWIMLNAVFAFLCYYASLGVSPSPPAYVDPLSPDGMALFVFAAACLRTVFDYVFGRAFLFP